MDWPQWINRLDEVSPRSPDIQSMIIAVVFIVGAAGIGWYVGRKAGKPLATRLQRLAGANAFASTESVSAFVQYATVALLLLFVGDAIPLRPLARIIAAAGFGVAIGLLVLGVLRTSRLPAATSGVGALVAAAGSMAGTLGGMQPLIANLDSVGFSVGTHRLSLLGLVNAVVVVAVLYVVTRAINHVASHLIGRANMLDLSQRALAQKLAGIGIIGAAVLIGVDLLGIDLTALAVFSGAAGLAVGFGLQKTFGNLIAGVILLMDRSVKPGDVIVVGETFGSISKIGVRAVSVVTRDGKEHLIPNEQLMTEPVENWS